MRGKWSCFWSLSILIDVIYAISSYSPAGSKQAEQYRDSDADQDFLRFKLKPVNMVAELIEMVKHYVM